MTNLIWINLSTTGLSSAVQLRLWISKAWPANEQQWCVAALFSLPMYDWQNRQWPVSSPTR